MDSELKNVFLYLLFFGLSDFLMETLEINTKMKKIIYLFIIFLLYINYEKLFTN